MNRFNHGTAPPKHRRWTVDEDRLLGTKPDRALAKKFGRTTTAVAARRHLKHISLIKKWRPEDDKLLGNRPDAQVAMLLKRPRYQVAYRRRQFGIAFKHPDYHLWKPGETAMLGWQPDRKIAELTGRTVKNVRHKRLKLGIPFFNPDKAKRRGRSQTASPPANSQSRPRASCLDAETNRPVRNPA
jgi:hypothetical protein